MPLPYCWRCHAAAVAVAAAAATFSCKKAPRATPSDGLELTSWKARRSPGPMDQPELEGT